MIITMHTRRFGARFYALAGGCAAALAALVAAWPDGEPREPAARFEIVRGGAAAPASASAGFAGRAPVAASSAAAATSVAPSAPHAAASAALPAPLPLREASDTGRDQPVFLGFMGPRTARVGRAFALELTAESENDFAGGLLTLQYDPARLRVAGVRGGGLLQPAGAAVSHDAQPEAGRLTIALTEQPGGAAITGGGALVVIDWVAMQPGETAVSIAGAVLRDAQGEGVGASARGRHAIRVSE